MSTLPRFRAILLAVGVLGLSGCITVNGSDSAQPQPSVTTVFATPETSESSQTAVESGEPVVQSPAAPESAPAAPEPAPVAVSPGTSCGLSNTGASTLVVAENEANLTCDQVQSIFSDFNATFTSGDTSNYQIQGFTCHTRSLGDVEREGRSVTCSQGGTRLEAMTTYPLGGVPVKNQASYIGEQTGGRMVWFATDFGYCMISNYSVGDVQCAFMGQGGSGPRDTPIVMTATEAPYHMATGGSYPHGEPLFLPQGQVLTQFGSACLNEGQQITCTNGTYSFSVNAVSDTVTESRQLK